MKLPTSRDSGNDFGPFSVLGYPTKIRLHFWSFLLGNNLKQSSFIIISAKNDLILHLFPGNKPLIESFKGGGGAG